MGKKAMFSHLSVPPIPPFFPYLSLLSLLPLLFLFAFYPPHLHFFCFVCCCSSYEMLLWRFHKELRFQPLLRRMGLGGAGGGGGISKAAFSCRYLTPPTPNPHPSFISIRDPHPFYVTAVTGVTAGCEDREQGGETIDRVSILSGVRLSSVTKPVLAESRPDLCCGKATPHRANWGSCKHMVLCGRSKKKRKKCTTKNYLAFSIFLENG